MTIHFTDGTRIHVKEKSIASCEAFMSLGFYATTGENIQIVVFYTAIKYVS